MKRGQPYQFGFAVDNTPPFFTGVDLDNRHRKRPGSYSLPGPIFCQGLGRSRPTGRSVFWNGFLGGPIFVSTTTGRGDVQSAVPGFGGRQSRGLTFRGTTPHRHLKLSGNLGGGGRRTVSCDPTRPPRPLPLRSTTFFFAWPGAGDGAVLEKRRTTIDVPPV